MKREAGAEARRCHEVLSCLALARAKQEPERVLWASELALRLQADLPSRCEAVLMPCAGGARAAYARSPRMRRASWMSLGMMVTRLAWMAHRLVSSNRPTR